MKRIFQRTATGVLLAIPFATIAVMMLFYTANVPSWDDYNAILAHANLPFAEQAKHLFAFHNEHRIVPVRLVTSIYHGLFGPIDFRVFMCIGNLLWCGFAALVVAIFLKNKNGWQWKLAAVSAAWFVLGFYDYENSCWAITAVQNHWVVVFAFLSFFVFEKGWGGFVGALVLAVMATFTSGGGMCAFPALALTAALRHFTAKGTDRSSASFPKIAVFALVSVLAVAVYFHGFPATQSGESESANAASDGISRAVTIVHFAACFLGNALPYVAPSTLLGAGLFLATLPTLYFFPRFSRTSRTMFAFLLFIGGNLASCALFRADAPSSALAGRYRLFSMCYMAALLYLLLAEYRLRESLKKALAILAFAAIVSLSLAYDVKSPKVVAHANAALVNNIQLWPECVDGVYYPDPETGDEILREAVRKGTYDPKAVQSDPSKRPAALMRWHYQ